MVDGKDTTDTGVDTTDKSTLSIPGEPKAVNIFGQEIDNPASTGFTADENKGDTQEVPAVEEPSDEAAKETE